MFVGPVFTREAVVAPRRPRMYLFRALHATGLFFLICTAWLIVAGTQEVRNVGDMARFAGALFPILAIVQLGVLLFFAAIFAAAAVAQEKDRRTLLLLLMTRLGNAELVLGKLLASVLQVLVMLAAAAPIFLLLTLLGGVSYAQVGRVLAVTLAAVLVAGSLGSTIALWREKTFQALAITALALVFWLGIGEALALGPWASGPLGPHLRDAAVAISPLRAVWSAAAPVFVAAGETRGGWLTHDAVEAFLLFGLALTAALNAAAIARVRRWNTAHEPHRPQRDPDATPASIFGVEHETAAERQQAAEQARSGHVDARRERRAAVPSRAVWDNPVLWREVRTRAYGRKLAAIRLAYLAVAAGAAYALHQLVASGAALAAGDRLGATLPPAAGPLAPLCLLSLVILNALGVTSITTERDGKALDLLLVSDLSPREFLLGKLGGVLWVGKEMALAPAALCIYLWAAGGLTLEDLLYALVGLAVLVVFVAMLGIHLGMHYANSRTAISLSLGTVFFLWLGVATLILLMISFSGSFQLQLTPFLAFMVGGGVGLYVTLGVRNASSAIGAAALLLPLATLYSITSFLLGHHLPALLVTAGVYGFTTAAMLVPALGEYNIAAGRSQGGDE